MWRYYDMYDLKLLQCPVCNESANPEELIPYRLFRDKVITTQNISFSKYL